MLGPFLFQIKILSKKNLSFSFCFFGKHARSVFNSDQELKIKTKYSIFLVEVKEKSESVSESEAQWGRKFAI